MKKLQVKKGERYGRLVVLKESEKYVTPLGQSKRMFKAKCDCGNIIKVLLSNLKRGKSTSCKCSTTTHGMNGTKMHRVWLGMKHRCNNTNYKRYGGRGISYCKEWKSFKKFYDDMNDGYYEGLSLDRIDNNGNYCKENCRWATAEQQGNNRISNMFVKIDGKEFTFAQAERKLGFKTGIISGRLRLGWKKEHLTKPVWFKRFG